jgi:monoterpene epsilon-lactone hydrolase
MYTLTILLSLKDEDESLPALAVLLSPWTDMEGTGESMETRADADPWLSPNASRARAAGVEVTFKVWNEMWHVFQTFAIPEGQQAIDEIGDFVQKHLEY